MIFGNITTNALLSDNAFSVSLYSRLSTTNNDKVFIGGSSFPMIFGGVFF